MANDEHLRMAFNYFDRDGNGYIEPDDLLDALMEDGGDDYTNVTNDIFQEVYTDKDGRISYDENWNRLEEGFSPLFKRKIQQSQREADERSLSYFGD